MNPDKPVCHICGKEKKLEDDGIYHLWVFACGCNLIGDHSKQKNLTPKYKTLLDYGGGSK